MTAGDAHLVADITRLRWKCPHEAEGRFCEDHSSWLCASGKGRCQTERFCPLAGPYPDV